jgi:hypothetical protein
MDEVLQYQSSTFMAISWIFHSVLGETEGESVGSGYYLCMPVCSKQLRYSRASRLKGGAEKIG